ncbi:hypothetical protein DFP94_12226 [Fontibacillus phaseoli]|uniref:Lipoprotein n=1 Tax=Fontibacillus phaseoli TaxID=1416533 RepID=A0A369AXI0_9BACL|nr:hypothetical protein [Fontibacillus phaseoli]RCX13048.1 hypothetical protein DFP94_12226 [Fontibacillus phaseoli]
MKIGRKSATLLLLAAFLSTLLAGCQENRADTPPAPSTANESAEAPTEAPTGPPAGNSAGNNPDSQVIKEGTIQKDGNVILKELAFVYNEHTIAVSDIADDEKLESMLGEAEEIKSHTYSEDDGLNMDMLIGFTEKQYKFPGVEIKTIDAAEGKKFYIFNINITDSKYATVRNIKVGDSVEQLKEAYPEGKLLGNGAPDEEDDFRYEPANYVDVMTFHIKDAKVESIQMYTLLD